MSQFFDNNVSKPSFWDDRYIKNDDTWDLNHPTPIFVNWEKNILKKNNLKICIPGCGKGHDAIYFASKGHNVYAIDFSLNALNYLKSESSKKNVVVNIIKNDFFKLDKSFYGFFDIILEYTFFCAIDPLKRKEYVNLCSKILKKNGKLIAIFIPITDNLKQNPPFFVSNNDINELFSPRFNLFKQDFSHLSIKSRKGNEIFIECIKK